MKELAGIEELPKEGLFFKVNKDVVKFIWKWWHDWLLV
jgi:hypothetical protein